MPSALVVRVSLLHLNNQSDSMMNILFPKNHPVSPAPVRAPSATCTVSLYRIPGHPGPTIQSRPGPFGAPGLERGRRRGRSPMLHDTPYLMIIKIFLHLAVFNTGFPSGVCYGEPPNDSGPPKINLTAVLEAAFIESMKVPEMDTGK